MDFGVPKGSEQAGARPSVIVSNDTHNQRARTVIVCPLTTNLERAKFPQNVLVKSGGLPKDSVVLGEQLRTISKGRLERRLGILDEATMASVDDALREALEL